MIRKIIRIDEEKCNGCGQCAGACKEGAIAMVDGKAKLMRDDYCDGLGNCLPVCPTGAISFEEREAAAYSEQAVQRRAAGEQADLARPAGKRPAFHGCPGSMARNLERHSAPAGPVPAENAPQSELTQWPVQIKLVPVNAPYFDGANLLIAADCTAYAYADFHRRFIRNHIALIGCPKLDEGDYAEKLTAIFKNNRIRSVQVVRMEVPCCGGIENAVRRALRDCGKLIPWHVAVVSTEGEIVEEL